MGRSSVQSIENLPFPHSSIAGKHLPRQIPGTDSEPPRRFRSTRGFGEVPGTPLGIGVWAEMEMYGGTPKWMVCNGKPMFQMDDLGVPPISGNLHMDDFSIS